MTQTQPMKIAAAEALYERPGRAVLAVHHRQPERRRAAVLDRHPGLLSFLATDDFDGRVQGIDNLQAEYQAKYGPGDYAPYVPIACTGASG